MAQAGARGPQLLGRDSLIVKLSGRFVNLAALEAAARVRAPYASHGKRSHRAAVFTYGARTSTTLCPRLCRNMNTSLMLARRWSQAQTVARLWCF